MSITRIVRKVFEARQKELEKHQNGGQALQEAVDHGDGSTDHFFSKGFGEVQKNVYLCKR